MQLLHRLKRAPAAHPVRVAAAALALLAGAARPAHAVSVSPTALYIDSRTRTAILTLHNPGSLPEEVTIDRRAVIGQRSIPSAHRPHRFELIAEDGAWTCALFAAVDTSAAAREAAARAAAEAAARADREARASRRADRSVQGTWMRSSLREK